MAKNNQQLGVNQAVIAELQAENTSTRITRQMPSFDRVKAGDTAVLKMPIGWTYDKIIIKLENITTAMLKNIKFKVGTKTIHYYKDARQAMMLNGYYQRYEKGGYLTFYFARPEFNRLSQRDRFGIGTFAYADGSPIQSFTLEIDIDEEAGENVKLTAWALQSPPRRNTSATDIIKIRRFPLATSGSGKIDVTDIPAKAYILAMHWIKEADDIDAIDLLADNTLVYNATKEITQIAQRQAKFPRMPQATVTHVDWALTGTPSAALRAEGIADFRFQPTLGSSGSYEVLVEYIDFVNGSV